MIVTGGYGLTERGAIVSNGYGLGGTAPPTSPPVRYTQRQPVIDRKRERVRREDDEFMALMSRRREIL